MQAPFARESREVLDCVALVRELVFERQKSSSTPYGPFSEIIELLNSVHEAVDNLTAQFNRLTELSRTNFLVELRLCSQVLHDCLRMRHLDTATFFPDVERAIASLWSNAVLRLERPRKVQTNQVVARKLSPLGALPQIETLAQYQQRQEKAMLAARRAIQSRQLESDRLRNKQQQAADQARPFFMHYTISEDRCGSQESTKSALLAALGTREAKRDSLQHLRRRADVGSLAVRR